MRKQFNLQDWLKDKNQKVETRSGKNVRIICWDKIGVPIVALVGDADDIVTYNRDGTTGQQMQLPSDLFIVTPEQEMSEFEKAVDAIYESCGVKELQVKKKATELLALAEKEIAKGHEHDVYIPEDTYYEQLKKQWEEGYDKGKVEALKDLPRWKKDKSFETEGTFMGIKGRGYFVVKDGYSISVAELIKKLPGFKED